MNEGLIPRRYAKALYKVGVDRGDNDALYALMNALAAAFAAEPGMQAVVSNPFVSAADKTALLRSAVGSAAAATAADATFDDFLRLLIDNRRIDLVRDIAVAYLDIYRKAKNIRRVKVTSAAPLAPAEEKRLRDIIAAHLGQAKMEYSSDIDPSLIGGFTVAVDSERLDASIRNDLKQLRQKLIQ